MTQQQLYRGYSFVALSCALLMTGKMISFHKTRKLEIIKAKETSHKRRKTGKKLEKLFDFKKTSKDSGLKFISKSSKLIQQYSQFRNMTIQMLGKVLSKDERVSNQRKQEYVFFKIFEQMKDRFKSKVSQRAQIYLK